MTFRSGNGESRIKKRKYSRRGCVECKRRKIKCDEALPECFNCTRLHKKCTYPAGATAAIEPSALPVSNGDQDLVVRFYKPKTDDASVAMDSDSPTSPGGHSLASHPKNLAPHDIAPPNIAPPGIAPPSLAPPKFASSTASTLPTPSHPPPGVHHNTNYMDLPFTPIDLDTNLNLGQDLDLKNLYNEANSLVNDIHCFLDGSDSLRLEKSIWDEVKMEDNSASVPSPMYPRATENGHVPGQEYTATALEQENQEPSPNRFAGSPENSGLIAEISAKANLDANHIKYLQTLTNSNLSYHLFPFASSIESNEVIKILLNYSINCEYLLNSLLAITATFQFNQSGDRVHETSRQGYIKQCFVSLSAAFKENLGFQNTWIFTNNVEKLLLTVLVLSSNFTACSNTDDTASQWIAHLKGARDLLLNYSKIKRKDDTANMSSGLALAKCWFFAIESSAAIRSSSGGSLSKNKARSSSQGSISSERSVDDYVLVSEAEHQKRAVSEHVTMTLPEDVYMSSPRISADDETSKLRQIFQDAGKIDEKVNQEYCHALERAQLLTLKKFNLYWGYSSAIAEVNMKYASMLEEMKSRGMFKVELRWTMHLIGMVDECSQDYMVPHVKADTFVIPAGTPGHPGYQGSDKLVLKASCYVREHGVVRSWFDLSHQFHCDDIYLRILTSRHFMALPRSHPDVQSIVRKVLRGSFFIREKPVENSEDVIVESSHYYLSKKTFDERCVMIQAIFRALSGIVSEEPDFERVELFFLGLVKLGNGSSLTSLDMLTKCRKRREKKKKRGLLDDDIYDLYEASVIPFA